MEILIQSLILIGGLILILLGANYLVDGASNIAKKFPSLQNTSRYSRLEWATRGD